LRELEERGLIVCKTPEAYTFKFYSITDKGNEIVEFLRAGKLRKCLFGSLFSIEKAKILKRLLTKAKRNAPIGP